MVIFFPVGAGICFFSDTQGIGKAVGLLLPGLYLNLNIITLKIPQKRKKSKVCQKKFRKFFFSSGK
jgi:hypothetical protein